MSGAVTKRQLTSIAITILFLLTIIPLAQANSVVFERYDTTATFQGNTILIERDVRIKNSGLTPIIPGEVHFRLYEQRGDTKTPIPVTNFRAHSPTSGDLTTRVAERRGETDLSVHLWNPLLPNFYYDFTMTYEMEFSPSGILFYEIRLPREDTTIPIVNENTQFLLDRRYSVTYAPEGVVSSATPTGNTVVSWDRNSNNRIVEYSRIPLPTIGVRAVNVFWIVIIVLLVAVFALSLNRSRSRGSRPTQHTQGPATGGWQQPPQQQQQAHYPQQPPQQHYQQQRYGPR